MSDSFNAALAARDDLTRYGDNARLLYALELRFQIDDIHTVAADSLVDGTDDKKADLVYIDKENQCVVIAQAYESKTGRGAKANKASDLNTAAGWLLGRALEDLPERLRSATDALRSAVKEGAIRSVQFWYVHNVEESKPIRDELHTVETTARDLLSQRFPDADIDEVLSIEVGVETQRNWYNAQEAPIVVTEQFHVSDAYGYEIKAEAWEAYVTAVPAAWLHDLYKKYGQNLFSANYRGYLGSRRSDRNINHGIKQSAANDPQNFWVFNNGITAIVNSFSAKNGDLKITGLSIVNGAQTTGAVGSLSGRPSDVARVPVRFVKCSDRSTISQIIRFNNSQNKLEAPDFRSTDAVQLRLRSQFAQIPNAQYTGGRRGAADDVIRRPTNLLPPDTVAQALAAFHQDPGYAYHRKSDIWTSNDLYGRYFNDQTTAKHIVFAYALLRCVEERKLSLIEKSRSGTPLSSEERDQLNFLRQRGAILLLVTAVARCLETFLNRAVPCSFKASFADGVSPQQAQGYWRPITEATIAFCEHLQPALTHGLNNMERVTAAVKVFSQMVSATKTPNRPLFDEFAARIELQ